MYDAARGWDKVSQDIPRLGLLPGFIIIGFGCCTCLYLGGPLTTGTVVGSMHNGLLAAPGPMGTLGVYLGTGLSVIGFTRAFRRRR